MISHSTHQFNKKIKYAYKKKKCKSIDYVFLHSIIDVQESMNDDEVVLLDIEKFENYEPEDISDDEDFDELDFTLDFEDRADDIEHDLSYNFKRTRFNRYMHNTKCNRSKKHNKRDKIRVKKKVHFNESNKLEKYRDNILENKQGPKSHINNNRNIHHYHHNHHTYNEEEALNRAIRESQLSGTSSGLTYRQILEIQTRELTPEDYELLLILDESIPKKTLKTEQISNFTTFIIKDLTTIDFELCVVCMEMFQTDEELTKLKCNHIFHSNCINNWLSSYSTTCPVDGNSLSV